ncbi:ATP-binding protein [Thiovibrio sp. JS02]
MKFRTKITLLLLSTCLFSIVLLVGVSIFFNARQLKEVNLKLGTEMTISSARELSSYFETRKAEITTYAHTPIFRTMDWRKIGPYLKQEEARHKGIYEKMLLGLPNYPGNYYITTEGNPHFGGLLSFDNSSPTARLKSIAARDYWQYTAGENPNREDRVYVSNPMVSYFTGVRQIMVASTILSEDNQQVVGMVSGSIEWAELERVISEIKATVLSHFGDEAKIFLISQDGTYVYHQNPGKAIHLLTDDKGEAVLNEIGEKITVSHRILEETQPELLMAGEDLLAGKSGNLHLVEAKGGEELHLFYAPVRAANYGLGVLVPKRVIMAPLYRFYSILTAIALFALALIGGISFLTARKSTRPLQMISEKAAQLSAGDWNARLEYQEEDEIGIVSASFNRMVDQLHERSKKVAESHQRLLTILDGLNAIVYVADMQTYEILYINKSVRDIFGDITGRVCWQTIQQGQNGPCPFCTNNRLLDASGEPAPPHAWEFQNTVTGTWYQCIDRAITWVDGRIVRMEIATDISGRKKAEAETAKLADIIEHSSAFIAICSTEGEIRYLNRAGRKMTGLPDPLPPALTLGRLLPGGAEHLFREAILPAVLHNNGWQNETELVNTGSNRMIPVEMNAFALHGTDAGLAVIARDISERKQNEEQLRQAQKMEAIGTLAGGIAHDFNNLLYAIQGYAELSLTLAPAGMLEANLQEILKASGRAAGLVKQILAFSRKMTPEKNPLSLQTITKETLKFLQGTLPATIAIQQDIATGCRPVLADATQIHQVIMNLCTNAYHAMQEEGGTLSVSLREMRLDADLAARLELSPGPHALLRIADTGHGIAPGNLKRIFEPYFTTKGLGQGTGLGLATVLGIVKSHQGAIRVESTPGQGTVMEVYFPVILTPEGEKEAEQPQEDRAAGKTGHALVVDDETALVELEKKTLESLGWRVSSFVRSTEAWAAFQDDPDAFDLVITDQTMPELTGARLAQKILAMRPRLPIILATGFSESIDENQAADLGIAAFLMKPFARSELIRTLQELRERE